MAVVEDTVLNGPVRIGIGTPAQYSALLDAGAEEVRPYHLIKRLAKDDTDVLDIAFREEDTVVMVQPNLLTVKEIKLLSGNNCDFYVPECGTFKLNTERNIRLFRNLKPDLEIERAETRHGKVKWPQPTPRQIKTWIGWWQSSMKRSEVVAKVREDAGAEVPDHWVRDQIIKATGTAARKPEYGQP